MPGSAHAETDVLEDAYWWQGALMRIKARAEDTVPTRDAGIARQRARSQVQSIA